MNYQLEVVNEKSSFLRFNEEQLFPNVVFRIKKEIEYPKLEYKNQYLNDILNQVKKNFIYSYFDSSSDSNTWTNLKKTFEKLNQKKLTTENYIEKSSPYQSNKSEIHEILFSDDNYDYENRIEVTKNTPENLFKIDLINILNHYLGKSALKLHGYFKTESASDEEYKKWAKYLEWIYYNKLVINKNNNKMLEQVELISSPYFINLVESIKALQPENINVNTSLLEDIIITLIDNKHIEFPKENIEAYFMDLVKNTKIAEYWNKNFSYIETNKSWPCDTEVAEEVITDFSDYIMSNLNDIINANVLVEEQMLENLKEEKEFIGFKQQYKILEPIVKIFFNENNILTKYYLEFHSILKEYHDERKGRIKPFLAAGQCFYDQKLFMNTNNIKHYAKWGKDWVKDNIQAIFLHELGHAIDYAYRNDSKLFFPEKEYRQTKFSTNNQFKKLTKCAYRTTRGYTKKQREQVNYYISPRINLNSNKIITYNWDRANTENFAESFAFISSWLSNGITRVDTFTVQSKTSKIRIKIKTFMRSLIFLLNNTNWEYLGICSRVLRNRKRMITQLLDKIDNTPLVIRNNQHKNTSKKIHSYTKPILRQLVS